MYCVPVRTVAENTDRNKPDITFWPLADKINLESIWKFQSYSVPKKFSDVYIREWLLSSRAKETTVKVEVFFAFSVQRKAQCVTWYHQTWSNRSTQRNYRSTYAESTSA